MECSFRLLSTDASDNVSAPSNTVNITTAKYQGYGYLTQGGGFNGTTAPTVALISSTADNGAGTLRECATAGDGRYCMASVGGTITLTSQIALTGTDNLTIDGSSAPSPGLTITPATDFNDPIRPRDASHLIFTYLRLDGTWNWTGTDPVANADLFSTDNTTGVTANMVLDHMTIREAGDSALDLWDDSTDVTMSYLYIMRNKHPQTTGGDAGMARVSWHHNLWAQNGERNPQLTTVATGGIRDLDMRNEIRYDWSYDPNPAEPYAVGTYGIRIRNVGTQPFRGVDNVNIVKSWFKEGPTAGSAAIASTLVYGASFGGGGGDAGASGEENGPGSCQAQGTVVGTTNMGDIWVSGNTFPATACDIYSTVAAENTVPAAAQVTTDEVADLCTTVLGVAGTHFPQADETALDAAIYIALNCPPPVTSRGRGVLLRGGIVR